MRFYIMCYQVELYYITFYVIINIPHLMTDYFSLQVEHSVIIMAHNKLELVSRVINCNKKNLNRYKAVDSQDWDRDSLATFHIFLSNSLNNILQP